MSSARYVIAGVLVAGAALWGLWPRVDTELDAHASLIARYCADCHNAGELAGGLRLEGRALANVHADAEIWEAVISKLDGGLMPPPGEPRPDAPQLAALSEWLKNRIDAAAAEDPNPGAPVLHRLNRAEYANAIRDLLDLPIDVSTLLPADDASEGFDNIANALVVSPAHMQAYVAAAARISRLAVGDPTVSPAMTTYNTRGGLDQTHHVEDLPLGTRGGLSVTHVFPLNAEYEITARRFGGNLFLDSVGGEEDLEVTLDGERLAVFRAGEPTQLRVPIAAGPHRIGAALIENSRPRGVDDLFEVWAQITGVAGISIMGPFAASGAGDTPSRRRIFSCRPASERDAPACARTILRTLASRAFRRPVEASDPSLETLLGFFDTGAEIRGFEAGIQYALARILVDPQFVFRFEEEPTGLEDGAVYEIDGLELASRISFFLWSSLPDDELLARADRGELASPDVRAAEVRRMLADDRAAALVENFAAQWLMLRQLETVNPASRSFDTNLRHSLMRETELLFESIVREDRSVVDLLDADYTYVDERLAEHYGIPHVRGSHFRRIDLPEGPRRGLLGHGSILTVTSAPNRTSPVMRGAWILENILGTPAPLPPPGVETNLDAETTDQRAPASLRARLERHRADPSCAACHTLIDPIGFALENFDEIGQWRERDGREPVDARATLWDGTRLDGPEDLRAALVERDEAFATVVTRKLLTYALGRAVEHYDMPAVRAIVRGAKADDYRFSALILGIVESVPFRYKQKVESAELVALESR